MLVWHSNTDDAAAFTFTICNTSMVHGLNHCCAMSLEPVRYFKLRRFSLRGQNCGWCSYDNSRSDRRATAKLLPTVKVTVTIKTLSTVSIIASMDHSSRPHGCPLVHLTITFCHSHLNSLKNCHGPLHMTRTIPLNLSPSNMPITITAMIIAINHQP